MGENSVGHALAAAVHEVFKMYTANKISEDDMKNFIKFCVDTADDYECDVSVVDELIGSTCTVCMKKTPEDELIEWNPIAPYDSNDPRFPYRQRVYNNCFGDKMVGGKVCLCCIKSLPDNIGED